MKRQAKTKSETFSGLVADCYWFWFDFNAPNKEALICVANRGALGGNHIMWTPLWNTFAFAQPHNLHMYGYVHISIENWLYLIDVYVTLAVRVSH